MNTITKLITPILSAAMLIGSMPSMTFAEGTREVLVTNTEELHAALADAQAGDEIILKEGLYQHGDWIGVWAVFHAEASGTAEHPIILRSEDPEHPATLSGVSQEDKYVLQIIGSYWEIRDLKLCEAAKGIFLEQSEHSIISGCEVYNIGDEGIHIIDNSSYNLVENCYIHDTGKVTPKYGEGVYIGSSHKTEGYGFDCHYNTVRGCRIGPNVTADHVDIKEYTIGNIVEECTFDGAGIAGLNGGDSFVEIKGNHCIVRNNIGYQNGSENMLYAFDANRQLDGWGQNNKVYGNTVHFDSEDVYMFKEWMCETQVFRNTAIPSCAGYNSSMTMQVLEFSLDGDTTEDGMVNAEDVRCLRDYLMNREVTHISNSNSDLTDNGVLDAFDLCILKRKLLNDDISDAPVISVDYTEEKVAAWRISDGLGGKTVTFCLNGSAGNTVNTGWGYWDGEYVNENGSKGKWMQFAGGKHTFDENGTAHITVEVPEGMRRVMLEVNDYSNGSGSLNKGDVELFKVEVTE